MVLNKQVKSMVWEDYTDFYHYKKTNKKKTVGKVGLCETMDKSGMKSLKIKNR